MQIGIDSFAAAISDPATGLTLSPVERMHHLLEEIELADMVGLDVFGIGEHHRAEFLDSAPVVILSAAAARTENIRLTSAVTVHSASDPVRVFQEFATLGLISRGRAAIVAGRGSFVESYPLFGMHLEDYDSLFAEKLELLLKIRESTKVCWSGKHRAVLTGQAIYPRPLQDPLPGALCLDSRLIAGPKLVRYSSMIWTSSAATVRRNHARMISGDVGLFK